MTSSVAASAPLTVQALKNSLALPVIASPMFLVSHPAMVIAQCKAGIVGAFPALNARPAELLNDWLSEINAALDQARAECLGAPIAPYAVNLIVHTTNARLDDDLATCEQHKVPLVITSLHAPDKVVQRVHAYGGLVFHDVTTVRHARKAVAAGVDGLILVCAGAGGHAGTLSPFALVTEVRQFYDGPLVLAGAITQGEHVLAAQAMGCDFAYMGTRFIAAAESNAAPDYKAMVVAGSAADIIYTPYFSGVPGNYLKPSIAAQGLDPDHLPLDPNASMNVAKPRSWSEIWSSGQGVGAVQAIEPVAQIVQRLITEYRQARARLGMGK